MSHPLRRRERQNRSLFNMDLPSVVSYEVYEVELREVERIRNCQRSPEVYTLFNNHRRLTRPINRFLSTSHVERDAAHFTWLFFTCTSEIYEKRAVDIPVLRMRKLTQSMAKKCVRGHTAFKWQLWKVLTSHLTPTLTCVTSPIMSVGPFELSDRHS